MATAAPTRRQWTEQERRNSRAEYKRLYKSPHPSGIVATKVVVPENVERRQAHDPCTYCGVNALTQCRHRWWLS